MTKEELSKLSKEQLEHVLVFCWERMDIDARSSKQMADEWEKDDHIWIPAHTRYSALRTMCNFMNIVVEVELDKVQ